MTFRTPISSGWQTSCRKGVISVWLVVLAGCSPEAAITDYSVPKPPPPVRPPTLDETRPRQKVDRSALPFTYALPAGWVEKPAGTMRMAEFEVRDGDRQVIASVSTAGGDLLDNVNRWRGQVQLGEASENELKASIRTLAVDGRPGAYVELVGPEKSEGRQTILGVIAHVGGRQWFVKLQGDADLAEREKTHFEQFAQSLRFSKTQEEE